MTVLSIDGHRIRKVRVRKIAAEPLGLERKTNGGILDGETVSATTK